MSGTSQHGFAYGKNKCNYLATPTIISIKSELTLMNVYQILRW